MRLLARLLALAMLCALPIAAHAAEFAAEGASGDRADRDTCEPGEYLVGVRFRAGAWLDQIQIQCAVLERSNGTLGPPRSRERPRGGIGGVGGTVTCPKDMWVTRMGFWLTGGNRQVRHVGMICEFPAPNGRPEQGITFGSGPAGTANPRHVCPRGEAAVGLNSRSGQHVNALGLICGAKPYRVIGRTGKSPTTQGPTPTSNAQLCKDHADQMAAKQDNARKLNCKFVAGSGWNASRAEWEQVCIQNGGRLAASDQAGFDKLFARCQADSGGGGISKTVVAAVTMYDKPDNGADVCFLNANDRLTVLTGADIPAAFRNADKTWVPVRGTTGGCNGMVGGVYDDGKLK